MKFSNISPTKLRLVQSLIITFLIIPCFKVVGEEEQIELTFSAQILVIVKTGLLMKSTKI